MRSAVVVGAGVFGGSLALRLVSSGWDVTLVEQYPPGHVRAASGGESRLIRFSHGENDWYTRSARRALELWRELERETGNRALRPDRRRLVLQRASTAGATRASGSSKEQGDRRSSGSRPTKAPASSRASTDRGLASILYEPEAGVLRARDATRVISELAIERGARFVTGTAAPEGDAVAGRRRAARGRPRRLGRRRLARRPLPRARRPARDAAGRLLLRRARGLAGAVGSRRGSTSTAASTASATSTGAASRRAPTARARRSTRTSGERVASQEKEREARAYLALRFPALAGAPLVGTRSCPYSLTEDTNFLIAPHPEHERVWLLGGGSGHGFKHGPALAEYVEGLLDGDRRARPGVRAGRPPPRGRFARPLDRAIGAR